MRRILMVLSVALVLAAMMVVMAAPAFAQGQPSQQAQANACAGFENSRGLERSSGNPSHEGPATGPGFC